jgi:hypothetical protein
VKRPATNGAGSKLLKPAAGPSGCQVGESTCSCFSLAFLVPLAVVVCEKQPAWLPSRLTADAAAACSERAPPSTADSERQLTIGRQVSGPAPAASTGRASGQPAGHRGAQVELLKMLPLLITASAIIMIVSRRRRQQVGGPRWSGAPLHRPVRRMRQEAGRALRQPPSYR